MRWLLPSVMLGLLACHSQPRSGLDVSRELPQRLSDWHLLEQRGDEIRLNAELMPYDLNSALFSDYAHKQRAIYVPRGTSIRYGIDDFEFPPGTVIVKTFYYPRAAGTPGRAVSKTLAQPETTSLDRRRMLLLETRLLINTPSGWVAAPYVWNAQQTEATLELAGESFALELVSSQGRESFEYMVPDANQCAGCHALDHHQQILKPIGVRARHLNKSYRYADGAENQLAHWQHAGVLRDAPPPEQAPRNARWDAPTSADLNARARAYLDVNCAHCHSAKAAANTSGLLLDAAETESTSLGVCKIPVASGRGSGTGSFDVVPGAPDDSILLQRMESTEADIAMPELGRSLVHHEGVALIREWIASLPGSCPGAADD
ncbi:MAG TPA: SO2930 family diheme c-type cytochrome [Povalibacter sp.]